MPKALFVPFYFPPIDYFRALVKHAVVLEWADRYQRQSYRNRCHIYGANGLLLLSVPVSHRGIRKAKDRQIAYDSNWQKQHWKSLESAYSHAPYFQFYEAGLRPLYGKREKFLYDLNLKTLELTTDWLELDCSPRQTQYYEKIPTGVLDFRDSFNAKNRRTANFTPYRQVFAHKHGFLPNLSILDLLFCTGPESISYLYD